MNKKTEIFTQTAESYDEWYYHPQGKQIFEAELNVVNSLIPDEGTGLEVGSGTGIFAERLSRDGRIIICLDPSKGMMLKSRERGVNGILSEGGWLPIRKNIIDFTFMITVLEFLDYPLTVFKEIRDTIKPDAVLTVLFINSESSWGDLYRNLGLKGDPIFQYAYLYNLAEVETILNESGYCVTEKVATLTTDPRDENVGGEMVEPSSITGVIGINALKRKI